MSHVKIETSSVNIQGNEELLWVLGMVNLAKVVLEELSDKRGNWKYFVYIDDCKDINNYKCTEVFRKAEFMSELGRIV